MSSAHGLISLLPLLMRPGGKRLGFPLGKTMAALLVLTLLGTAVHGQAGWGAWLWPSCPVGTPWWAGPALELPLTWWGCQLHSGLASPCPLLLAALLLSWGSDPHCI